MENKFFAGFVAGCIGAVILAAIMYIMKGMGMGEPAFVGMYQGTFGTNPPADQIIAAILFIISGGIWGLIYAALVKVPTILNGMLFGFLPTIWLLVAVNAYLGKPLFNGFDPKGIIMPIIFNVIIWGSFLGWYMANRTKKVVQTRTAI